MSALHEQQQQLWYNNQAHSSQVTVKSEPIDYAQHQPNRTPPQTNISSISPILSNQSAMDQLLEQIPSSFRQLGVFNPLTPPGYSGLMFPSLLSSNQWTPSKLQNLMKIDNNNVSEDGSENPSIVSSSLTPPMDVTPPKSPKEHSMSEQTPEKVDQHLNGIDGHSESLDSYDEDSDDYGDDDRSKISNKRKSSNGKPKQYKCKQCKQISVTKQEFWDHTRSHIKPEKMLQCPKCPFVTEYKHHLEYHLRNHSRSKPFQCPKCSYSCVNKSMLNSHLKSHSTVLQYRCSDCNYATKYCHSLKLHLRKYTHKPDIVLNLDGTPNPLPIIDVYGTRRGPKSKTTTSKLLEEISRSNNNNHNSSNSAQKSQLSPPLTPSTGLSIPNTATPPATSTSLLPNALMANMLQNVGSSMPLFPYLNLNFQMFAAHQQKQQQQQQQQKSLQDENLKNNSEKNVENANNEMHDLINENDTGDEAYSMDSDDARMDKERSTTPSFGNKNNRRKGRAFKLDEKHLDETDDIDDENSLNNQPPQSPVSTNNNNRITTTINATNMFECKFCGIIFKDNILYSIHMGYHGYNDVFHCNMCGTKTENAVQFFLHIAKYPHS
jgi:hunchback-like protein